MPLVRDILLVLDGSPASLKAGEYALDLALKYEAALRAVYMIDGGWAGMLGDEWINTSDTRMKFFRYFEGELHKNGEAVLNTFKEKCSRAGLNVSGKIAAGKVEDMIARELKSLSANAQAPLLVVPNPSGAVPAEGGLKIPLAKLLIKIKCPVFVGPL